MIADPLAWLCSFSLPAHPARGRRDHSMAQIVLLKIWSPLAGVPDTYIPNRQVVLQKRWIPALLVAREYLEYVTGERKNKRWGRGGGEWLAVSPSDSHLGSVIFCTFLIHKLE